MLLVLQQKHLDGNSWVSSIPNVYQVLQVIPTSGATTPSITTLSSKGLNVTLSITTLCHYAECRGTLLQAVGLSGREWQALMSHYYGFDTGNKLI